MLGSDSFPFFKFQKQTSKITSESTLLRYWREPSPPYLQTNIKILVISPSQATYFSNLQVELLRSFACSFKYEVLDNKSCFKEALMFTVWPDLHLLQVQNRPLGTGGTWVDVLMFLSPHPDLGYQYLNIKCLYLMYCIKHRATISETVSIQLYSHVPYWDLYTDKCTQRAVTYIITSCFPSITCCLSLQLL